MQNLSTPGDSLIYNLIINDMTPAYTTFVRSSCVLPLAANLTTCTPTAPGVGGTGALKWTFGGALAPAASGVVEFSVQVNP